MLAAAPACPSTLRTLAVSTVSPTGKAISDPIPTLGQNWIVLVGSTKKVLAEKSRVQASPSFARELKRHPRSLIGLIADPSKTGGSTAGTPPGGPDVPSSHTAALPFPSGRLVTIIMCGKLPGLYVVLPTERRSGPGRASRTTKNPCGTSRS